MDDKQQPTPKFFLDDELQGVALTPLYSNFVGVHEGEDEIMLAFCIRRINPMDAAGKLVGIDPHTNIFLSMSAAKRLFLALKQTFEPNGRMDRDEP